MPSCAQGRLYKILKWVFVLGLVIASFWFMTDVWDKFESKRTGYTVYEEDRQEMPTTVVCFEPYGKPSVMEKYGFSLQDMVLKTFPESVDNMTWQDFRDEMQYVLGQDFYFTYYDDLTSNLETSANYTIDADGLYADGRIEIESLQTVWSGLCVRITYNEFVPGDYYSMYIEFKNDSLLSSDVPNVALYVTSEENVYGIIGKEKYHH